MFIDTRALGSFPDDTCPLGASRVDITDVPRVKAVYVWGGAEPSVLAVHGWGTDSTAMSVVVDMAMRGGESVLCFDAPGHGISPGTQATITEYATAIAMVLQRFPSIRTVVAHSLASIAAVAAVADSMESSVRAMLLLAPTCSLAEVLNRWVADRGLPVGLVGLISDELARRDGVPVSHWDIRTLALPSSVRVQLVHDPEDSSVPVSDSLHIAEAIGADLHQTTPGVGHHGVLGCEQTRLILTAERQHDAGD